jgi:integrase
MHRQANRHVKVQIGTAFDQFKAEYPQGRARNTVSVACKWIGNFIETHGENGKRLLGAVRAEHINDWLSAMRTDPDSNGVTHSLAPSTLQHRKMYISSFFSWASERYDLHENPVANAMTIAGATKRPEIIEALSLDEIRKALSELKPEPYWHAFFAFAVLAGPRWGEQIALPVEAVNLTDRYITIRASKTGRQRRVPIEKTTLLPILKKHVAVRMAQQKSGTTAAARSLWLFPSDVPPHPYIQRTVAPEGQWSGPKAFHEAWGRLIPKGRAGEHIWKYGPREWRHTFGTALGQAGMSGIEIARMMGNSPGVADAHYVAVSEAGRRWPFQW